MLKKILIFGIILTLLSLTVLAERNPYVPVHREYGPKDYVNNAIMKIKELSGFESFLMSVGLFTITPSKNTYTTDEPVVLNSQLTTWNLVCEDVRIVVDVYKMGEPIDGKTSDILGGQTTNRDLSVSTTFSPGTFSEGGYGAEHYAWCMDSVDTICANNPWPGEGNICDAATAGDKRIAIEDAGTASFFVGPGCTYENCFDGIDNDCNNRCDTVGSTCTDGSIPGDPVCVAPCADQPCEDGIKECSKTINNQYRICKEQLDGCFDWGGWNTCTSGVCKDGQCDASGGGTTTGKTCYKCVGETLDIKKDQTTCPTGYSTTKPTVCGSTTITPGLDPNDWEVYNITLQDKIPPSKDVAIYFCIKNSLNEETTSPVETFYLKKTDVLAQQLIDASGYLFSILRTGQVEIDSCKIEEHTKAYNITIPANGEVCLYADPKSPSITGEYIVAVGSYNNCGEGHTALGVKKSVTITAVASSVTEICDDLIDNDFDGSTDMDDSDCAGKGRPYIKWDDVIKITETQARESGCNTDDECINDNCLSLDYIDSKVSGTSDKVKRWYWWDRDGLCMEEEKKPDLMSWIEDNTGLTGTYAYAAIGAAAIFILIIVSMLMKPPKR